MTHSKTINRLSRRLINKIDNQHCQFHINPMDLVSHITRRNIREFNLLTQKELKHINEFLDNTDCMDPVSFSEYVLEEIK